jgi:hypothetical protein
MADHPGEFAQHIRAVGGRHRLDRERPDQPPATSAATQNR